MVPETSDRRIRELVAALGTFWNEAGAACQVSIVEFLPVHVRVRPHGTSLHRSVHSQRQVPRIQGIFTLHHCQRRHCKRERDGMCTVCVCVTLYARQGVSRRNGTGCYAIPDPNQETAVGTNSRLACCLLRMREQDERAKPDQRSLLRSIRCDRSSHLERRRPKGTTMLIACPLPL